MEIRFLIDLDTGLPHSAQHNVEPQEVLEIFRRREADFPGRNDTRLAEGQTEAGRFLRVIYAKNEIDDSILVITAYDITGKAKQAFRKRRRRKKR